MLKVSLSTSVKIGFALQYFTTFAVATKVKVGTITSSPDFIPIDLNDK